jgi:hypothetical protein
MLFFEIAKFGNTGKRRVFLTDYELAAIDAIREVFPTDTNKGCTFHFRQALMRPVQDLGLRAAYSGGAPEVRQWIRQIMGMTLLPEVFVPFAWQMLRQPPAVSDVEVMMKLQAFNAYFDNTWISGSFGHRLWTHFNNIGPRTTNLAEGWHNSLNYSFGIPHPSPRNFLHWLQTCQFQVQCREIQLEAGRPTKLQSAKYRQLDERIASPKLQFGLSSGSFFLIIFTHPDVWPAL